MANRFTKYLFLAILLVGSIPTFVNAQLGNEYFNADQLLRQQKYEEAYEKFYQLHQQNPSTYIFFEKTTECLINLKEYDQAISLAQDVISKDHYPIQAQIRLGEIYHISGKTERAFDLWDNILDRYEGNQQTYLRVARAMKNRDIFDRAIEVYKTIRKNASASNVITSELANTYLQAGRYEKAIQEFLQLVKNDPNRMNYVQRRLIRFQDNNVYDIAILEISDFLDDLSKDNPSYRNLQQLEVWLLMERKLFKRALVTAKNYEEQSPELTYSLYNIGSQLLAEQEFELAEQAFSYYIDKNISSIESRCMEELASVYIEWARYLKNYNLGLSSKPEELYQKAYNSLNTLFEENPNYPRQDDVLVSLSELSLDIFHDTSQASKYLQELESIADTSLFAQKTYIQGRLNLYKGEYTRARIAFTKSNKQERIGSLAEKTRYYLALTDFYGGDYEFAKIQLNALERQNTSYFANDAVQLRLWIQNGLQADSTGAKLKPFAKAVEHFSQGDDRLGINKLKTIFENNSNPLVDEALLELATYKNVANALFVYRALSNYLDKYGSRSPLYERLLWEKARLADQFVTNEELAVPLPADAETDSVQTKAEYFGNSPSSAVPKSINALVSIYEDILIHFPNGFYASYVRDRIQELQNIQT